jgi:purine nucleoside permease
MRMRLSCAVSYVFVLAITLFVPGEARAQQKPWPVRAVIVVTFEVGADTGDAPGEFQFWVEREHLTETLEFPGGVHPLRTNKEHTILGMVSGEALVNATASMMALGLDPRFDLTHAYFLINGIAGVDPLVASVGSAAWASYAVHDISHEIDSREAPADWPYGFYMNGAHGPNPPGPLREERLKANLFPLNAKLAAWAYAQTKDLKLGDDPKLAEFRAGYTGFPNGQRPPFVLMGDSLSSDVFWHGAVMTQFARDWVKLYTGGKGTFAMTEMEDSGFMAAIQRLEAMHRMDGQRVMILRTASNFSQQRPGQTAIESASTRHPGEVLAFESAWLCGSTVLHKILEHWDVTYAKIPGD